MSGLGFGVSRPQGPDHRLRRNDSILQDLWPVPNLHLRNRPSRCPGGGRQQQYFVPGLRPRGGDVQLKPGAGAIFAGFGDRLNFDCGKLGIPCSLVFPHFSHAMKRILSDN